jgi:hypothetical protein
MQLHKRERPELAVQEPVQQVLVQVPEQLEQVQLEQVQLVLVQLVLVQLVPVQELLALEQEQLVLVQLEPVLSALVQRELVQRELEQQEPVRLEPAQPAQLVQELEQLVLELQVLELWELEQVQPELELPLMKEKVKLNPVKPLVQLEQAQWAPLEVVLQVRLGQVLLDRVQQLELQVQARFLQCNFTELQKKGYDMIVSYPFFMYQN